ncbi:MAG: chalcone isomerase family protein [Psychromonas sp.]
MVLFKTNKNRNSLLLICFSLCILAYSSVSKAQDINSLRLVGQGGMSWMFMDIYQASLYSQDGTYQHSNYPQALTINYKKNISKSQLIKATKEQWKKLSVDNKRYQPWINDLNRLWPDIAKGDKLTLFIEQGGNGYFYHNGQLIGSVDSPDFAPAFLSIWLSEKTSQPRLRKKLIGG